MVKVKEEAANQKQAGQSGGWTSGMICKFSGLVLFKRQIPPLSSGLVWSLWEFWVTCMFLQMTCFCVMMVF